MALTSEQARQLLSQMDGGNNQPSGEMTPEIAKQLLSSMDGGQTTPPPSPSGQMPGLSAPTAGKGGFSDYMKSYLDATVGRDYRAAKSAAGSVGAIGAGGLKGLLGLGRGMGEYESKALDYFLGTKFAGKAPRVNLPQSLQKFMGQHPIASGTGEVVAPLAAALALPGGKAFAAEIGASMIPRVAAGLGNIATRTGISAALAPAFMPEKDVKTSMVEGGILGLGGEALGAGVSGAMKVPKLAAKMIGGTKSLSNLLKLDKASERLGINLSAPDRIDSPGLKRIQDTAVSKIPFSGMVNATSKVGDTIKGHMENLLSKLNPSGERAGSIVKNELQGKYDSLESSASDKYDRVSASLSRQNPPHDVSSLSDEASKIGKKISRDASFGGKSIADYNELKPLLDSLDDSPVKNIGDAFKMDKIINARMRDAEGEELKMLSQLKGVNKDEISKTVKKYGSDDLNSKYNIANNFYKKVFVPYRDNKEIAKILHEDTKIDQVIPTIFSTSSTKGKGDILESVSSHISQKAKDAILHEHLSTQLEDPNKKVLSTIKRYENLQKTQKDKLISKENRQLLDDMSTVKNNISSDSFNKMFVEKTGASLQPYAAASLLGTLGHAFGGNVGALAAAGGGIGAGRLGKRALMSDMLPDLYKKYILESAESAKAPQLGKAALGALPLLGAMSSPKSSATPFDPSKLSDEQIDAILSRYQQ